MSIKPIETRYKGYRFRSRLEARYAVFFTALGIKWEYEKEGYNFSSRNPLMDEYNYLPDFYLPDYDLYVEIKPTEDKYKEDLIILYDFCSHIKSPICVGIGQFPNPDIVYIHGPETEYEFSFESVLKVSFLKKHGIDYFSDYIQKIEFPIQSMKGVMNY